MKINQNILSIPPHISTEWKNIATFHIREDSDSGRTILIVTLSSGSCIEVPNLNQTTIEEIFAAHARYLESGSQEKSPVQLPKNNTQMSGGLDSNLLNFPFSMGTDGLSNLNMIMLHNQEQSHSVDLPPEILKKTIAMIKALGIDSVLNNMQKAEPHCNCFYCQIARSLYSDVHTLDEKDTPSEELVSDEDLKFKDWIINQINDNLYNITNPLDTQEHYQVFLGKPLGCTCGAKDCEHIRTVLNS